MSAWGPFACVSSAHDLFEPSALADTKPEPFGPAAVDFANNSRVNDMSSDNGKRGYRNGLLFAGVTIASTLAMSGLSQARLANSDLQLAQATPPLQSTPGAETKPSAPTDPTTTGTDSRPSRIAPEPAHPDPAAQKEGATPALPPAPAEKIAPPIKDR
jgi:hypothetical protein